MDNDRPTHYARKLPRWLHKFRKSLRGSRKRAKRVNWKEISEDNHEGLTAVLFAESDNSRRIFRTSIPNPDVKIDLVGKMLCHARAFCSLNGIEYINLRLYRPDKSYIESRSIKQWAYELFGK